MKVDIIIPCRNEVRYITKCVESILGQNYPQDNVQVIIVDGMSNDGTREAITDRFGGESRVLLCDNPNLTTPFALNLGIQSGRGDVSIIFGAHAEMGQNYIAKCVDVLSNNHSVGCAGGRIINVDENPTAGYISQCMSSSFGVGNAHFRTGQSSGYVDTVAFGAYRKEVFKQIGYFNEALTRNQDDELNYRLVKGGWKIYLDLDIRSKYYVRGSYQKLARQYYQYGYWKVYVNTLHRTITTWRQLVPFFFVGYLIMSSILLMIFPDLWGFWLLPLLVYLGISFKVSASFGGGITALFNRIKIFFILHLCYGWGYWIGLFQFLVLRKAPAQHAETTSR